MTQKSDCWQLRCKRHIGFLHGLCATATADTDEQRDVKLCKALHHFLQQCHVQFSEKISILVYATVLSLKAMSTQLKAYQEFALLFPAGALGVGVPVGFGHHPDQLPLCGVWLWPRL